MDCEENESSTMVHRIPQSTLRRCWWPLSWSSVRSTRWRRPWRCRVQDTTGSLQIAKTDETARVAESHIQKTSEKRSYRGKEARNERHQPSARTSAERLRQLPRSKHSEQSATPSVSWVALIGRAPKQRVHTGPVMNRLGNYCSGHLRSVL